MKLKGIILAVIISLASIMMPFNVYADTISTNNIEGINTVLLSKTQNTANTNSYWYVYEHTITLDANYVGTINLNINLTYYTPSGSPQQTAVATISNKYFYVNGNTIKINQIVTSDNYGNQGPIVSSSYLLNSSNVIKYDDIDSLEQIINLLLDIYQNSEDIEGLSTNQLLELQNIVTNTSLANQYLDVISKIREFNVPLESYSFVYYMISKNYEISNYDNYNYLNYPRFILNANDSVINFSGYVNGDLSSYDIILTINRLINSQSTLNQYFSINDGNLTFISLYERINYNETNNVTIRFRASGFTSIGVKKITVLQQSGIVPICIFPTSSNRFSTEFALKYGLSNQLLDDIHVIANGTNQSNSAAADLESGNDQMANDMDNLASIENGYNQQFNNQLQSIDFTSPLQSNAGILPAANFVITIFNGLINNNPFSVLIIVVCILLIGKKVIGK